MLTPERFLEAVVAFQSHVATYSSCIPDDLTFIDFINTDFIDDEFEEEVTSLEYDTMVKSEENAEAMSRLTKLREHYYLRQLQKEPKGQTGMIFALKQKKNGGYSDKQEVSSEKKLTIHFAGVGGEEAYK